MRLNFRNGYIIGALFGFFAATILIASLFLLLYYLPISGLYLFILNEGFIFLIVLIVCFLLVFALIAVFLLILLLKLLVKDNGGRRNN